MTSVRTTVGTGIIDAWLALLDLPQDRVPVDADHLIDSVSARRGTAWIEHLYEIAIRDHTVTNSNVRLYTVREVKEITKQMNMPAPLPLSAILERSHGTLRFGHALRQRSQQYSGTLTDLIDALDSVQTLDQLITVAAQIAQASAIASAKSPFGIVPSDLDFKHLLDDAETYRPPTVAKILIVLSALRYPPAATVKSRQPRRKTTHPVSYISSRPTKRRRYS